MNNYMKVIIEAIKQWVNRKLAVLDDKINNKIDSVEGKMLSTNDYTNEEKEKLASIEAGATKTIIDDALDAKSTNPVQNAVVKTEFDRVDSAIEQVRSEIPEVPVASVNGMTGDVVISIPSVDGFATETYVSETIAEHLTDTELVLTSSTSGSTKKFKLTIDDDGVLTATEIVE